MLCVRYGNTSVGVYRENEKLKAEKQAKKWKGKVVDCTTPNQKCSDCNIWKSGCSTSENPTGGIGKKKKH